MPNFLKVCMLTLLFFVTVANTLKVDKNQSRARQKAKTDFGKTFKTGQSKPNEDFQNFDQKSNQAFIGNPDSRFHIKNNNKLLTEDLNDTAGTMRHSTNQPGFSHHSNVDKLAPLNNTQGVNEGFAINDDTAGLHTGGMEGSLPSSVVEIPPRENEIDTVQEGLGSFPLPSF